ncbi:MAG TPA: carbon storage regulator CsrA [Geobacteraceae bacterium]|nr:carbon storage regulator CsrA [Geobacteraceae bacterium]
MLVLTRKVGEEIFIGDSICVKVMEISGSKVRLGIDAPAHLRIYREEVLAKVRSENRSAAEWELTDFGRVAGLVPNNYKE